jgi:hypothetical protein
MLWLFAEEKSVGIRKDENPMIAINGPYFSAPRA